MRTISSAERWLGAQQREFEQKQAKVTKKNLHWSFGLAIRLFPACARRV
jgi:hypothetical protein